MTSHRLPFVAVWVAILAPGSAVAATLYVSNHGADAGNCTTSPCASIQYAVTQAAAGDTIVAGSGIYSESVTVTKRLTLLSDSKSGSGGGNATIDASGHDNGIVISGAAAAGSTIRGFTVRYAGREGILAVNTSNLTIADNRVIDNDTYGPNSPQCPSTDPDDCGEAIHLRSVTNSAVTGNLVQHNVGGILLTDETGPASGNLIANNRVLDNRKDCGITLASHYFHPSAPVAPGVGGVYQNLVWNNTASGNGAAGIGIFAGPPGAAAWGNVVRDNVARNNGLPGVAIHSHTPAQYVNDNVIDHNTLSGNGPDDDAETEFKTGISVFSAVIPIPHTTITNNTILDEYYGIFTVNAVTVTGLPTNNISPSVKVPVLQK
jgi:parallel beta-helix repeat protein